MNAFHIIILSLKHSIDLQSIKIKINISNNTICAIGLFINKNSNIKTNLINVLP